MIRKREGVRITMQKHEENNYEVLLILTYFKSHKDYSYQELSIITGMTLYRLNEYIADMIDQGLLEYKEHLLALSFKGRVLLQKSTMEYYDDQNMLDETVHYKESAWPIDQVYVPKNFEL